MMDRWLRCHDMGQGVFSDERTVTVRERGTGPVEFIVPLADVREDESTLRVKAYPYDGGTWALIPTAQPETIPIDDSELVPV